MDTNIQNRGAHFALMQSIKWSIKQDVKNWKTGKLLVCEGNLETRSRIFASVRRNRVLSDKPASNSWRVGASANYQSPLFYFNFHIDRSR